MGLAWGGEIAHRKQNCTMAPPMMPQIDSPEDMRYFEALPLDIPIPGEEEDDGEQEQLHDEHIFIGW